MNTVGQILGGLYIGTLIGLGSQKLAEILVDYADSPTGRRHARKVGQAILDAERQVAPAVNNATRLAKTRFRSAVNAWAPVAHGTVN